MTHKILMRIDFQNDFVDPNGLLSLKDVNLIHKHQCFARSDYVKTFDKIIDTYDTHYRKTYPMTVESQNFPIHCVYGSWGWLQAAPFPTDLNVVPMYKSTTNIWLEKEQYRDLQENWSDKTVYLCGVLSDVCVQQALNGLLQRNAHVVIIEDLCKGANYQIDDIFKSDQYIPFIKAGLLKKTNTNKLYLKGRAFQQIPQYNQNEQGD